MQETVIEQDCSVSAKEFYRTLLISAAQEASAAIGTDLGEQDIRQGYHYRHATDKGEELVTFKKLVPGREYGVKVARNDGNIQIRYRIDPKDDDHCHVTVTQTLMTKKKSDWFSSAVMKNRLRKRINLIVTGTKDRLKQEAKEGK